MGCWGRVLEWCVCVWRGGGSVGRCWGETITWELTRRRHIIDISTVNDSSHNICPHWRHSKRCWRFFGVFLVLLHKKQAPYILKPSTPPLSVTVLVLFWSSRIAIRYIRYLLPGEWFERLLLSLTVAVRIRAVTNLGRALWLAGSGIPNSTSSRYKAINCLWLVENIRTAWRRRVTVSGLTTRGSLYFTVYSS